MNGMKTTGDWKAAKRVVRKLAKNSEDYGFKATARNAILLQNIWKRGIRTGSFR